MKLIVGLGNPGAQYTRTRHNAGFMVVARLLERHGGGEPLKARFNAAAAEVRIGSQRCLLLKPTTYMNRSGQCVGEAVRFYKSEIGEDLLVVVDDLYLPVGSIRLKPGGGAGGHNGLTDIQRALGSDAYPRLRVGVGLQPSGGKPPLMDQADFVLGRFTAEEEPLLPGVINKGADAAEAFATGGLASAMNAFNAKEPRPEQPRREKDPAGDRSPSGPNPESTNT